MRTIILGFDAFDPDIFEDLQESADDSFVVFIVDIFVDDVQFTGVEVIVNFVLRA